MNMDWIGTAVGFVLGVVSTLFTERINLWLNRPGIHVSFQPDEQCLRETNAQVNDGTRIFLTESKFLRIKVSNRRRHPAKGCRCLITAIRRVSPDGSETILGDTLPLRWAYLGFQPIDIPAGTTFYADILSTLQSNRHFTIELEAQPLLLQQATTVAAMYIVDVAVVGDNFDPVALRIHFDWKQDWDFSDVWAEQI